MDGLPAEQAVAEEAAGEDGPQEVACSLPQLCVLCLFGLATGRGTEPHSQVARASRRGKVLSKLETRVHGVPAWEEFMEIFVGGLPSSSCPILKAAVPCCNAIL